MLAVILPKQKSNIILFGALSSTRVCHTLTPIVSKCEEWDGKTAEQCKLCIDTEVTNSMQLYAVTKMDKAHQKNSMPITDAKKEQCHEEI